MVDSLNQIVYNWDDKKSHNKNLHNVIQRLTNCDIQAHQTPSDSGLFGAMTNICTFHFIISHLCLYCCCHWFAASDTSLIKYQLLILDQSLKVFGSDCLPGCWWLACCYGWFPPGSSWRWPLALRLPTLSTSEGFPIQLPSGMRRRGWSPLPTPFYVHVT